MWTYYKNPNHWYRAGYGIIRKIKGQWYFANDTRPEVVGTEKAVLPKGGPFATRKEATAFAEKS